MHLDDGSGELMDGAVAIVVVELAQHVHEHPARPVQAVEHTALHDLDLDTRGLLREQLIDDLVPGVTQTEVVVTPVKVGDLHVVAGDLGVSLGLLEPLEQFFVVRRIGHDV
jgi:hypothetical protein